MCLDFLCFELDSQTMEVPLLWEKSWELQHLFHQWVTMKSCTQKELKLVTGKLGYVAKVVQPRKTFMCRICKAECVSPTTMSD